MMNDEVQGPLISSQGLHINIENVEVEAAQASTLSA
jgi:hypothetical protein